MQPLIDADILLYEIGFSSEKRVTVGKAGSRETETFVEPQSWEFAQTLLDNRIKLICDEAGATSEPLLFLTNTRYINKLLNKSRKYQDEKIVEFQPNFREKVATTKEYKGNRKSEKPFHYKNLINYILATYPYFIAENGLEADDAMCIHQTSSFLPTIICSRDKDVKQCKGWHYSWECGKQPSFGPFFVEELGFLKKKDNGKIWGVGQKFFYYQLLTGDSTDNIIGVMGKGPDFAYKLLKDAETEWDCYQLVAEVYVKQFDDEWEVKLREMADLLYMIRELNEEGEAIKWKKPLMPVIS